ncbi:MAG: response regulator, partial [Chitinophagaceae bacterium]|nr:response regulator [Chitinophagaceae bacterium]
MSDIRILIVEDEPLIAEDIAAALTQVDFSVTGVAYDAKEALLQLSSNTPDLVLLDINLGGGDEGL